MNKQKTYGYTVIFNSYFEEDEIEDAIDDFFENVDEENISVVRLVKQLTNKEIDNIKDEFFKSEIQS
jgi:hypothetical protein